MPRYFFHVHDGHYLRDTSGVELADTAMAQTEAARLIGALWFDHPVKRPEDEAVSVEVTNTSGLILFTMTLRVTRAPALPLTES